jgi:hypothetical protein
MSQKIIDRSYVGEVLQNMYSSDLRIKVTLFSAGGYFYITNEERRTPLQGTTIEEAVTHLALNLAKEFPASQFAAWWNMNFRDDDLPQQ